MSQPNTTSNELVPMNPLSSPPTPLHRLANESLPFIPMLSSMASGRLDLSPVGLNNVRAVREGFDPIVVEQ